mgnify:CR=1 FL=1
MSSPMTNERVDFHLYRINVVEPERDLFSDLKTSLRGEDSRIIKVFDNATSPEIVFESHGERNSFEWSLRHFEFIKEGAGYQEPFGVVLARSVTSQASKIVTEDGIEDGISIGMPPPAQACHIVVHIARHILAVESVPSITKTNRWIQAVQSMIAESSQMLGYSGHIELEPIPRSKEILATFDSFSKIFRFAATIRLPNPELSRFAQGQYEIMKKAKIDQMKQDMKSSQGLSKDEADWPRSSAELAQSGYKKGDVVIEGIQNGKRVREQVGRKPMTVTMSQLRDYVRGLKDGSKAKEATHKLSMVINEIDRALPPPESALGNDERS